MTTPEHHDPLDARLAAMAPPRSDDRLRAACRDVAAEVVAASRGPRMPGIGQVAVVALALGALALGLVTAIRVVGPGDAPTASTGPTASPGAAPTLPGGKAAYTVTALNGAGINGVAARLTPEIAALGYAVTDPGNAMAYSPDSFVMFAPGREDVAANLAHDLDIRRIRPADLPQTPVYEGVDAFVVVGRDGLGQRYITPKPADRRTRDACSPGFERWVLTLRPADRTIPAGLTWSRVAHMIAGSHARGCQTAARPIVADDVRREFEFAANNAWAVAYVRAADRGDRRARERAVSGLVLGVARPAVLRGYADAPDILDRRLARAAQDGDTAFIRGHVTTTVKPAQNRWLDAVR